ncbi:alpha/beta fold hydrolase [Kineosporia sp. NBRC 101731]|uniref:alpha/beta hydrolase n=1 Tax=Kineosporia sp. NBRC 101731 TaxID=3032199 RepID=UPI002556BFD9|nr:alpha/beta fold hydrolase [Kineosporia sp. NBRC 101731]
MVNRPVLPNTLHGRSFPLFAVRTGPRGRTPVLFVPGGPGLASVIPYLTLRRAASRQGLDVIMVEHRGVGLSRRDDTGHDLPVAAITVEAAADDLAAVLQACAVPQAVVYGSSYGSYLAQVFAARHPDQVASLVLDSPLLSAKDDLADVRAYRRRLLWGWGDETLMKDAGHQDVAGTREGAGHGERPDRVRPGDGGDPGPTRPTLSTASAPSAPPALPTAVRNAAAAGVPMPQLSRVVEVVYEFAGPDALLRLLRAAHPARSAAVATQPVAAAQPPQAGRPRGAVRARLVFRLIARSGRLEGAGTPHIMEPDLVSGIAFATLGFGLPPDGAPLDPQLHLADLAPRRPGFTGDPIDLSEHLTHFTKPLVVITGERDLRTPRPVAERIVALAPHAVLVPIADLGHSALDSHYLAAIHIARALADGRADDLRPPRTHRTSAQGNPSAPSPLLVLAALPRRGPAALLRPLLRTATWGVSRERTQPRHQ